MPRPPTLQTLANPWRRSRAIPRHLRKLTTGQQRLLDAFNEAWRILCASNPGSVLARRGLTLAAIVGFMRDPPETIHPNHYPRMRALVDRKWVAVRRTELDTARGATIRYVPFDRSTLTPP